MKLGKKISTLGVLALVISFVLAISFINVLFIEVGTFDF